MSNKFFIDIDQIANISGLSVNEIAKELFPNNNYPTQAMSRVRKGKADLSVPQLITLSEITGISIDDILNGAQWQSVQSKLPEFKFKLGDYTVLIDTKDWRVTLFDLDSKIHETMLVHRLISLSDFLSGMSDIIIAYEEALK